MNYLRKYIISPLIYLKQNDALLIELWILEHEMNNSK